MAKGGKKKSINIKNNTGEGQCVKGRVCSDHFTARAGFLLFYHICGGVLEVELPQ